MRELSPALQAHLQTQELSLCRCWLIVRRDGKQIGITEHDTALRIAGVEYQPSDLHSSAAEYNAQLANDEVELFAKFSSAMIAEADLAAGLYDGAEIQFWLVNWRDTNARVRMAFGHFGKLRRTGTEFVAEISTAGDALHRKLGRVYQSSCDAEFGDARCGIDIHQSRYFASAVLVERNNAHRLRISTSTTFPNATFANGYLLLDANTKNPVRYHIRADYLGNTQEEQTARVRYLTLWTPFPVLENTESSALKLIAGCDKTLQSCQNKFNNALNFRGCPHIPGEKLVLNALDR